MNSFLLRRLAPFYALALIIEFLTLIILLVTEHEYVDWSFVPMVKTVGVLLKTTTISFLYMMLPYVIYLLLLPAGKVNSKLDRWLTTSAYTLFIFLNLFEETMSLIFWDKFSSAFNFLAVEYLVDMGDMADEFSQNYLFVAYLAALFVITFLIVRPSRHFLFNSLPSPHWFKRFIYALIYVSFCGLVYVNLNEQELEINENYFNNELSKDGAYSLVRSLWKSNLSYKDFYPHKGETLPITSPTKAP